MEEASEKLVEYIAEIVTWWDANVRAAGNQPIISRSEIFSAPVVMPLGSETTRRVGFSFLSLLL